LQNRRDALRQQWATKNAAHVKARVFIYEKWPHADLLKEKTVLDEAEKALDVCRNNQDILTPQKLLQAAIAHAGELQKRKAALDPDSNEEDRTIAKEIADRAQKLRALITDVQKYLQDATGGK